MGESAVLMTAAYGLRIEGLGTPEGLALCGVESWPAIRVSAELTDDERPNASEVRDERATIVNPAATFELDRLSSAVRIRSPEPLPEAELVHPWLWPVAAVFARWRGAETLHAGAFVPPNGGGAWAVMADSGGGKTSFLAMLALRGVEVLADDLLVLEFGDCVAGPRALDLRPDVVAHLDLSEQTPVHVRASGRLRLRLSPCPGRWPVNGFVELRWADHFNVERLDPAAALAALARHRRVRGLGTEYRQLLELVDRPVLAVSRPYEWSSAPEVVDSVLEAICRASA